MAAGIVTPSCEATGLPLPILPKRPRFTGASSVYRPPNYHHHFHPENDEILRGISGSALRGSRVQYVNYELHTRYHQFFAGPELPETEDELFRLSILSAAGVVPRRALDLSKPGEYKEVSLKPNQHYTLSQPRITKVDKPGTLAVFMAGYASKQQVEDIIDNRVIEEFLDERITNKRRRELSSFILAKALGMSLEFLDPIYNDYKKEGYLAVYPKPEPFRKVAKRLIRRHSLQYFSEVLSKRLAY